MHLLAVLAFCATLTIAQNVTYDYVIAGAGTAGLLLATILSENPNITVLVLEAGADGRRNPNITNPELRGTIQGTQYDWAFETTPQAGFYANGTQGSQMVPRGKTLGGTAAMNWMIHNTDSRVQLDIWESLLNLTGWNWQSMSTAFRESETMYAPPANMSQYFPYNAGCHGGTGPIYSTFQRSVLSLLPQYLQPTLQAAGFKAPEDAYCGDAVGPNFFALAINPFNYTRSYSGSVYSTVEYRSNLHVRTNAQVTRINWSTTTGNVTASGLSYIDRSGSSNTTRSVRGRQVILSAGCIQSSQILELSGVGDPSILQPLGIQPVVNLSNVGVGLRDPPMTNHWPLSFNINTTLTGKEFSQNFIQLESASKVLTSADYAAASTWLNSTSSIPGLPDAQLQVFKTLWYTEQPLVEFAWQYTTQNVTPYNLIPLSQGTVHINSSNPLAPPAINPNYNSVNATINGTTVAWDMWFLAKAAQYYQTKLATTAPMSTIVQSTVPDYRLPFTQYYDEVFRATGTSEHLTGGNPMLARAAGGVVDTSLLVYGTTNVRVVDGSVFPYQPSAHPMGVTYALAVRAARILQGLQGGGGLTGTEQLPASNSSANATASFGIIPTGTPSGIARSNNGAGVIAREGACVTLLVGTLVAAAALMLL